MVGRWSLERVLLILSFLCSASVAIFGMGVQWNKTTTVDDKVEGVITSLKEDYVRRDVYASDQRLLTEAINRLTRALEQRDEPARPSPSFSHGDGTFGGR